MAFKENKKIIKIVFFLSVIIVTYFVWRLVWGINFNLIELASLTDFYFMLFYWPISL